jgi:glucose-1-phosphate adenylyltransferase
MEMRPGEAGVHLVRRCSAIVLAGGRGSRLMQLTDRRAKPAVYFGGKFRIIDFALSNCLNSGIRRISVATQYKSHSLLRHLQRGWSFMRSELNESVDLLPAQQRVNEQWYMGTADAITQNLDIIRGGIPPEYILVLAGDHIYKMDYSVMLADHVQSGRGVTVGCLEVPRMEATAFGVMAIDEQRLVHAFVEKPADPPAMPGKPDRALGSMGIYIFNADYLYRLLEEDSADAESNHDFGKDIIPKAVTQGEAFAHPFSMSCIPNPPHSEPYWRDVGTVDAFWAANLDLASPSPALDMYDLSWPVWTYQEQLPPAKFVDADNQHGSASDSLVSGGCIVSGATVSRSVLFSRVHARSGAQVDQAVVLPDVDIGKGARLSRVVIDRGCVIPAGMEIGHDPEIDAQRFLRTESGVVLVTRDMLSAL